MKLRLLALFALISLSAQAVDFSKLSRNEPVSTAYPATFKCFVDVSLFLNVPESYKQPVFLRVSYIIGTDTLNDNITVKGSTNQVIKQLFLDENERATVQLLLNNSDINQLDGVEGSLRIVRNPEFKPEDSKGKHMFLSGVWKSDQTPLFRIGIKDSIPQIFRLNLTLNENYEFDKLFLQLKVISPKAGIIMVDKAITINEADNVTSRNRTYNIDISEIDLSTPGTYYFQVMQNMVFDRVNGIENIDYEIVQE